MISKDERGTVCVCVIYGRGRARVMGTGFLASFYHHHYIPRAGFRGLFLSFLPFCSRARLVVGGSYRGLFLRFGFCLWRGSEWGAN